MHDGAIHDGVFLWLYLTMRLFSQKKFLLDILQSPRCINEKVKVLISKMKNSKNTYSTSKLVMLEQPVNRDFKSQFIYSWQIYNVKIIINIEWIEQL